MVVFCFNFLKTKYPCRIRNNLGGRNQNQIGLRLIEGVLFPNGGVIVNKLVVLSFLYTMLCLYEKK